MKRISLLVSTLLLFAGASAQASTEFRNRLFIGGGYGATWPEAPNSFRRTYKDGQPAWTGYIGYGIAQDAALRASYTNMKIDAKNGRGDILLQPMILSLKLHLLHDVPISPYVLLGAGVSSNRQRAGGAEQTWTDFAAQGGFGLEFFIGKNFSLAGEGRYDYIEPKSGAGLQLVSALGLANIYFGTEDRTGTPHEEHVVAAPTTNQQTVVVNAKRDEDEQSRLAAEKSAAAAQQAALAAQQAVGNSSATAVAASTAAVAQAQSQVNALEDKMQRKEVSPIVFETNSDRLMATSDATLDQVATIANQYPNLRLRVDGYTDNVGSDQKNLALSQSRADAVKTYLVGKGVAASHITATGHGAASPVASNTTAEGRERNRRVEFTFGQ